MAVSAGDVSIDVLANILGYLDGPKDIMQKRRVCKKWKEAVKKTTVPPTAFLVNSVKKYSAMNVMTRELPNLQQIKISYPERGHKWSDGEDPNEELATRTADWTSHDIGIISNFSKLRILEIQYSTSFNGRYPAFFNFPLLQKLSIQYCHYLKWDLDMLAALPMLKELECSGNQCLTGNINSLRVLKDTLQKVTIEHCLNVEGNFMDLENFPHLKELNLFDINVTGDIRDIGENDFSSLERLILPNGIFGGSGYQFQSISDGADLIRAVYLLKKHHPSLNMKYPLQDLCWSLMEDSPDRYAGEDVNGDDPPFYIAFVKAGSRLGYRWKTDQHNPCEVNWLDPEPDRESSDYGKYVEELQEIERDVSTYRGFHQPPTEEQYLGLVEQRRRSFWRFENDQYQ